MEKLKRIIDHALLASFKNRHCTVCSGRGCDPCHIRTVGAGGHDVEWNLLPLCRKHHSEQHKIGIVTFAQKYTQVLLALKSFGWKINEYNKLVRDDDK